jgi:hypothetical protein
MSITQTSRDRWLGEGRSLLLQVASVLVPETWNVLVNPQHAEATRLRITATYEHAFDEKRLDSAFSTGKLIFDEVNWRNDVRA